MPERPTTWQGVVIPYGASLGALRAAVEGRRPNGGPRFVRWKLCLEPMRWARSCTTRIRQTRTPAMRFHISEGFFDLHPARVELSDSSPRGVIMRKRSGQQPWRSMQAPVHRLVRLDATRSAGCHAALCAADRIVACALAPDTAESGTGIAG
jgi:hypothetical protein